MVDSDWRVNCLLQLLEKNAAAVPTEDLEPSVYKTNASGMLLMSSLRLFVDGCLVCVTRPGLDGFPGWVWFRGE
jgi:hypothetical protein